MLAVNWYVPSKVKVILLAEVGSVEASTVADMANGDEPLVGLPSDPNVPVWS